MNIMRTVTKKTRQLLKGSAVIFAVLVCWWVFVYSPLRARVNEQTIVLNGIHDEQERLIQKYKRLSASANDSAGIQSGLHRISNLLAEGQSVEEINAATQVFVQEFLAAHETPILAYKEISPSKWRKYTLGRVQIELNATTQGISELLNFLENLDKLIRIEHLSIISTRRGEDNLRVSLGLGTLLLKEGNA